LRQFFSLFMIVIFLCQRYDAIDMPDANMRMW